MAKAVEIVTLVDNVVFRRGLLAEHGLAFLIRAGGRTVLFDTGAGAAVVHNALSLGMDPRDINAAVLSHGHDDHTGGLKKICEITGPQPVYAHPDALAAKYRVKPGKEPQYIGIPWSREELEKTGAMLHLHREPVALAEGVVATGEIPRVYGFEALSPEFCVLAGGEYVQDRLLDDQALVLDTREGLVVILGCAHAGLINTLEYILQLMGSSRIYAVIGGTHLKDADAERLEKTAKELSRFDLQYFIAGHCTGLAAGAALYRALGDKLLFNEVGRVFKVG
ncbi:MAG TPA: MBL fold metallo-hydrolase [Peptococcaceae bacterium]|nr:MBL fold metallo-hydrolase [Peptococcaceae bacterium]